MKFILEPVTLIGQTSRLVKKLALPTHQIIPPFALVFAAILKAESAPSLSLAF
jgi:hypothetical protein